MLTFSAPERRALAESILLVEHERSDRTIHKETGLSRELIKRTRAELIRDGLIPARERIVGADGKTYPVTDQSDRPAQPELARSTRRILEIAVAIDGEVWSNADDLTRRSFRFAVERLLATVRRLEAVNERSTG
jgi:DNA-binding transcriptional MocR family regulator